MQGVAETKNITPQSAQVAYDLALGLELQDIADHLGMPLDRVQKIARGNLVQKKVKELTKELEDRMLDEQAKDPVRQFLAKKGMAFAKTIVQEATNDGEGASPVTRLKAAELGLKFGGRDFGNKDGRNMAAVQINISMEKAAKATQIETNFRNLTDVPDYVDG